MTTTKRQSGFIVRCGLVVIVAGLTLSAMTGFGVAPAVAAQFSVGDDVRVDGRLNLRVAPGLDAEVEMILLDGTPLTISDGPVAVDGYEWYEVALREDGSGGWVAGAFLLPAGSGDFGQGTGVRVVDGPLNVRDAPSLDGEVFTTVPEGTVFFTTNEARFADGHPWYKVKSFSIALPLPGNLGWVAGDFLVDDPGVTGCEGQGPCPTGLVAGDGVRVVTDALNLRAAPALNGSVRAVLPEGTEGVVEDFGEGVSDGHVWLRIMTESFGGGWVAREFVVADPSAGGSPEFGRTDTVEVVDGALTLRQSPMLAGEPLAVMADGTILTVMSGPVVSDGYTWYRVSSDAYGVGWAAGEFLSAV